MGRRIKGLVAIALAGIEVENEIAQGIRDGSAPDQGDKGIVFGLLEACVGTRCTVGDCLGTGDDERVLDVGGGLLRKANSLCKSISHGLMG